MPHRSQLLLIPTLLLAAGTAFSSPSAAELLKKKGFSWRTVESDHVRLHYEPENKSAAAKADYLKAKQERAYIMNLRLLGVPDGGDGKVDVFVVSSRDRMKRLTGDDVNGVAYPTKRTLCFIFNETLDVSSPHEMMHVLAGSIWGLKFKLWISEGWAGVADNGWHGYDLYNLNKYLLERKKLVPLSRVIDDFGDLPNMITYPEAAGFVKFLHERYGAATIRSLWPDATASGLKRLTGKGLAEIETEWHRRLMEADSTGIVYNH